MSYEEEERKACALIKMSCLNLLDFLYKSYILDQEVCIFGVLRRIWGIKKNGIR